MPKDEKRGAPIEDLVSVSICNKDPTKMVKVGSNLPDQHREQLIDFLKENFDVITWSHVDMQGIPPSIAYHKKWTDYKQQGSLGRRCTPTRCQMLSWLRSLIGNGPCV